MYQKNIYKRGLTALLSGLLSFSAYALPEVSQDEGWSGDVAFGVGGIDLESNTIAGNNFVDLNTTRIYGNDLDDSADGRTRGIGALLGEVRWTLGNRNQLFIGTSEERAVTMDGGAAFGWRKGTDSAGTFEVAGLSNMLVPMEVYEDSFDTTRKRKKTDSDRMGLRFTWDRIFNTGFEWAVEARKIDVDKDREGSSLSEAYAGGGFSSSAPGQGICLIPGCTIPGVIPPGIPPGFQNGLGAYTGLTSSQLKLLERDADDYSTRVAYKFEFDGGHSLRPMIIYKKRDADGDAQSFDGIRGQLTYSFQGQKTTIVSNVTFGQREFDKRNPIYNDYRDSDTYAIDATVFYTLPWDDGESWRMFVNATFAEEDSDIDFYDQQVLRGIAGVQYKF